MTSEMLIGWQLVKRWSKIKWLLLIILLCAVGTKECLRNWYHTLGVGLKFILNIVFSTNLLASNHWVLGRPREYLIASKSSSSTFSNRVWYVFYTSFTTNIMLRVLYNHSTHNHFQFLLIGIDNIWVELIYPLSVVIKRVLTELLPHMSYDDAPDIISEV